MINDRRYMIAPPQDVPQSVELGGDYHTVGQVHNVTFARPYPQASQVDGRIPNVSGPAVNAHGAFSPMPGLGGVEVNPSGFARPSNPIVGGGVNLHPQPTGTKGAFDMSRFDLTKWFPGVMTTLHTTRKPGSV